MPNAFSTRFAQIRLRSTRLTWASCGAAALVAAAAALSAQAVAPGVRIVRDPALYGRVWPADMNGDGRADLISSSEQRCSGGTCTGPNLQVSLGRGDGTFVAPVRSSFIGSVMNTTDLNGDGRRDVIAETPTGTDGRRRIVVLPGTGTATVGAPVAVTTFRMDQFSFAASGDLNGDGKRDLVLPQDFGVAVYPGRGNLTFDPPVQITTPAAVADAIVADLNKDGLADIVTANNIDGSLTVVLNRGGLVFSATEIRLGPWVTDVTATDVNRDGRLDLLVSAGRPDHFAGFGEGFAFVLPGNGNGSFGVPVRYEVPHGPTQIVAVDANRDGIVDLVTGNQSAIVRDDCTLLEKTWDSVSVLIGTGTGTFVGPWNFSIGDQRLTDVRDPQFGRFKNSLISLNTADLNNDGRVDLIASLGAVLFNIPAVANRAPAANFGPDIVTTDHEIVLQPSASDRDEDLLGWEIRDESGQVIATYPTACWQVADGRHTFTVTVDDGHGHTATDSVVITVQPPGGGSGLFGPGQDIGSVGAAGFDAYSTASDSYTVQGSGADIWGTTDEFRYVSTPLTGDFTIAARVETVQNVNAWTKAGLMIRENLTPGSRHTSIFATPGKGIAFQRRTAANGTSLTTSASVDAAPVWLQLSRRGNVVYTYWRKNLDQLWTLAGQQTFTSLPPTVYAGLAVTSHQDGTLARAVFSDVVIDQTPWTGRAIGSGTGSASSDGVVFNVAGRGADIWGTSDAFYYVQAPASGNFSLTARVRSVTNTHAWAKAGVMIRESLAANAKHGFMLVSAGKGVSFQYRTETGGQTFQLTPGTGTAPAWLQISRSGDRISAAWSANGTTWNSLGFASIPMAASVFIGLPVTSHNTAATATAVFDDVRVRQF
jgi:regulation of enolase protein 1 (concanavalin A-like superfamily)